MLYSQQQTRTGAIQYYWEYVKRFGKESAETFRRDFFVSILIAALTWLLGHGDRSVRDDVVLGLEATFAAFSIIALGHLVHVSHILYRERFHPETGGMEVVSRGYGVLGLTLLLMMFGIVGYISYDRLLRRMDLFAISIKGPAAPDVSRPANPPASESKLPVKKPNPESSAVPSQVTTPSTQAQAQPLVQAPSPARPATFLDRVVQKNRGLTPADRNRLSDVLYSADKYLKDCEALGYKLNLEFGALTRDRVSGELAKNVDDHIKVFHALKTAGWDEYHALQKFQADHEYFSDQTQYIFGDNPYNAGIGLALNGADAIENQLGEWAKIQNRSQQEILNLVGSFQSEPQTQLDTFFKWTRESLQRITQMRQSLDPNGVVQPLPSNTSAPAAAMFSQINEARAVRGKIPVTISSTY